MRIGGNYKCLEVVVIAKHLNRYFCDPTEHQVHGKKFRRKFQDSTYRKLYHPVVRAVVE